jgi:hypothetical protein
MYNGQSKREYERIEKPYMGRLRIKQYEGLEISSAEWDMVALRDLSAGGALFYYGRYLGLSSLLDLKIDVSIATPTINCVGRVIRIEQTQPYSIFRIATEFTKIEEQEKEMINRTVADNLSEYETRHF